MLGVVQAVEDPGVRQIGPQVGEAGIVRVEHQRGVRGQRPQAVLPPADEVVQVEITVHLVPEDVREDQGRGADVRQNLRQRPLVDLKKPDGAVIGGQGAPRAGVGQQGGRQAPGLIRPLLVGDRKQS